MTSFLVAWERYNASFITPPPSSVDDGAWSGRRHRRTLRQLNQQGLHPPCELTLQLPIPTSRNPVTDHHRPHLSHLRDEASEQGDNHQRAEDPLAALRTRSNIHVSGSCAQNLHDGRMLYMASGRIHGEILAGLLRLRYEGLINSRRHAYKPFTPRKTDEVYELMRLPAHIIANTGAIEKEFESFTQKLMKGRQERQRVSPSRGCAYTDYR